MGEEATERAATADEIARMRAIVREAIDAGAVGFATSKSPTHVGYAGRPVPSRLAELAEIRALAGALGEAGARHHPGHASAAACSSTSSTRSPRDDRAAR